MKNTDADHARSGNRQAMRRFRGLHIPDENGPHGLVNEPLTWAIFDVESLCFGARLVLVAARHEVWVNGQDAIFTGLLALIGHFKDELRLPTTCAAEVPAQDPRSIWVLQTPAHTYQWVVYDQSSHRVSWHPVFSLDPRFLAGSETALKMLFPLNAAEGIQAMKTQFWAKLKS